MAAGLLIKSSTPRTNPSSGSQNLENLNTEFQPRLLGANASFGLLLGRNTKEASSQAGHTRKRQNPKSVRANLLIVILSCVQF